MKKLFLAATLAACTAVPAFAQDYYYPGQYLQYPGQYLGPDVVIDGNQIIGQDPDPNVRFDLRRNAECYLHSCG
ncbi:MAG: hypothetical protein IT539_14530 [Bradyrhizobiaceae bacterium]|nr:hypothetical protein [Bradyrhizobiaceae bacterium]